MLISRDGPQPTALPQLSRNQHLALLTATDYRILDHITWLLRCARRDQRSHSPYITPAQTYLAQRCDVTREHIQRRTDWLARSNWLTKIWRRPVDGKHQTCIYRAGPLLRWLRAQLLDRPAVRLERVMYPSLKTTTNVRLVSVGTILHGPPTPETT